MKKIKSLKIILAKLLRFSLLLSNFAMSFSLQMEENVLLCIQELTQKNLKSNFIYILKNSI